MENSSKLPSAKRIKKFGLLSAVRTWLRGSVVNLRTEYLRKIWGMDISEKTMISLKANLDRTFPQGIHIGEGTAISFGAVILSHDYVRSLYLHTRIGNYCQIGAQSLIMPGITIGDHCIVGAGTVVTKDVPPRSIVVGNPGRIIRQEIMTGLWGVVLDPGQRANDDAEPAAQRG